MSQHPRIDKQIVNILDRLHSSQGHGHHPCQWYYSGSKDIYHCPHTAFKGSEVIPLIQNYYQEASTTKTEWDSCPESQHGT